MNGKLIWTLNLIALGTLAFAFWYGYQESRQLEALYQSLNTATGKDSNLRQWEKLLNETAAERKWINDSVITAESLPSFIDRLEEMATSTRTELDLTSAIPGDKANPNIKLSFSLRGSYQSLLRFTTLLDSLPVQLKITAAEFNRASTNESNKTQSWQARLALELISPNLANNAKK